MDKIKGRTIAITGARKGYRLCLGGRVIPQPSEFDRKHEQ
jgi:hypothetical protein